MGTASEREKWKGRIYLDISYYQSQGKSRSKGSSLPLGQDGGAHCNKRLQFGAFLG
jgi:hypothetical protein